MFLNFFFLVIKSKYFEVIDFDTSFFLENWVFDLIPEILLVSYILYSLVSVFNDNVKSVFQYYRWLFVFFVIFLVILQNIIVVSFNTVPTKIILGCTWISCYYTLISKLIIITLVLLVLLISKNKIIKLNKLSCMIEFPLTVGFSVFFMFFLTSSYDFFSVYLSIEGLSLTLYVMAAMFYNGIVSIESAIKYFSLGAISSGILLLGISIIFSLIGMLDFLEIYVFLGNEYQSEFSFIEIKFAFLCIFFGLFFKLSAFPCHIWVADVYEGVWTPITAFFAIVVKITLFLFFIRVIFNVLFNFAFYFQILLLFVSLGSMVVGTFGALKQVRIKRFIAYTSINQVGFILLGIACLNLIGLIASFIYLILYSIMSISFFAIILNTEHIITKRSMIYLSDLQSLSLYNTEVGKHLVLVVMSMAGLPPLGGFIGKLFLYYAVMESRFDLIIFTSMLVGIVSTYYYLNLVKYIWFEKHKVLKLFYYIEDTFVTFLLRLCSLFLVFFVFFLSTFLTKSISISFSCMFPFICT